MNDKNMADVADKAVDKLAGGIEQVAKAFEQVAPHVWEVMVRQARIEGAIDLGSALAIGLSLVAFAVIIRRKWPALVSDSRERERGMYPNLYANRQAPVTDGFSVTWSLAGFVVLALAVATLVYARSGITKVTNPQYYAAQELLSVVK